jgi:hypothetical protein
MGLVCVGRGGLESELRPDVDKQERGEFRFVLVIMEFFVSGGVAGHGRQVGMGAAAAVVAGVLVVSVGAGGAVAVNGSGPSRARHGAADAHARPHQQHRPARQDPRQAAFEVAKARTLEALYEDGMESRKAVEASADVSPRRYDFNEAGGAEAVRREWRDFEQSSLEEQQHAHLLVLARRLVSGQPTPQVRLIFPSMRYTGAAPVEEYITDQDETWGGADLERMERDGWRFFTKIGRPPLHSMSGLWWPIRNYGATRRRVEHLLDGKGLHAQALSFLYRPENHEEEFDTGQIIDGMGNGKYSSDNKAHKKTIASVLSGLTKAGVVAHPTDNEGRGGVYRALNAVEIQARDSQPIETRVNDFLRDHGDSLQGHVLKYMYETRNRDRVFNRGTLVQEVPEIRDGTPSIVISPPLSLLTRYVLIEEQEPAVKGPNGATATYRSFPLGHTGSAH